MAHANKYPYIHKYLSVYFPIFGRKFHWVWIFFLYSAHFSRSEKKIRTNFCLYQNERYPIKKSETKKKSKRIRTFITSVLPRQRLYCVGFNIFISQKIMQTTKRTHFREGKKKIPKYTSKNRTYIIII